MTAMLGVMPAGALRARIYFLVPRQPLQLAVEQRARRVAADHLTRTGHLSRLEDQALSDSDTAEEVDALAADLVDRRGLWSGPK